MATIERVGSFSISDFDAELRALQQLSDQASREWQAAAQRGHEARLQSLSEQAAAARQLNSLRLEAAQKGLRLKAGSGGGGPNFNAQIGPFSLGTGTQSPEFEKTPEMIEAEKLELMQRKSQLDQLQQQLDINQRSLDMPGKTEELRRRVLASESMVGPPVPGQNRESILAEAPAEVAGQLRSQFALEREREAGTGLVEQQSKLAGARAGREGMWAARAPEETKLLQETMALPTFTTESMKGLGLTPEVVERRTRDYYTESLSHDPPIIPTASGAEGYVLGTQTKKSSAQVAIKELTGPQTKEKEAASTEVKSQVQTLLEKNKGAKYENIEAQIDDLDFVGLEKAIRLSVDEAMERGIETAIVKKSLRQILEAKLAETIGQQTTGFFGRLSRSKEGVLGHRGGGMLKPHIKALEMILKELEIKVP